jgi:hypothetical protein
MNLSTLARHHRPVVERLGGVNVSTGQLVHVRAVSNDWPECDAQCGLGTANPFFPLSGSGAAYPFPSPRVTEGHQRGGVVIANNMLYWRVIKDWLAGISHRAGASCVAPNTARSHFLAHAYIVGDKQETLRQWFDRPWARRFVLDSKSGCHYPRAAIRARFQRQRHQRFLFRASAW